MASEEALGELLQLAAKLSSAQGQSRALHLERFVAAAAKAYELNAAFERTPAALAHFLSLLKSICTLGRRLLKFAASASIVLLAPRAPLPAPPTNLSIISSNNNFGNLSSVERAVTIAERGHARVEDLPHPKLSRSRQRPSCACPVAFYLFMIAFTFLSLLESKYDGEAALVAEVLFALQGVDGVKLRFDDDEKRIVRALSSSPPLLPLTLVNRRLMMSL